MQAVLLSVVVLAVLGAAPASADSSGPLQFLFAQCPPADDTADVGECVSAPLRAALERQRPLFATGVSLAGKKRVLEPLSLEGAVDNEHAKPRWSIKDVQLAGLSTVELGQVQLTRRRASVEVSADQLTARLTLEVKLGFLPLRPRLALSLQQPRVTLAAQYSATTDGSIQLTEPTARLRADNYNCTISGAVGLGRGLQAALNSRSRQVLRFLTPSLEAALARRVGALSQEELRSGLAGLRRVIDAEVTQ